jgi:hypothetical protein
MKQRFLITFLALSLAVTFLARESYFRTARYADDDHAANALQIARAKEFRELHGNYSRWSFHHPGPAFFYVAALGEWILCDLTHLAPTPHSSHLYTSAMLQLAFYAGALALIARHSRRPWLFIATALVAGALHFPHIDRVFFSLWPPDVLLMPMLCFLAACAAVAVGDTLALPAMVIAGGFLVHGHIAQPLFVIPLSTLASIAGWHHAWRGRLGQVFRSAAGLGSVVLLALFLLPLALDLLAGRQSNAQDVLAHLRFQRTSGQTLWQSFLCYLWYFTNSNDPSVLNQLSPEVYDQVRRHVLLLSLWAAMLVVTVVWCYGRAIAARAQQVVFGRRLLFCWLGASLLTLVWGMRQDGGFTYYNSQFNNVLVHLVALLALFCLVDLVPPLHRAVQALAVAAAVIACALANPYEMEVGTRGEEINARITAILQADPHPDAPKLFDFVGDEWASVVTLGSALQQRAIPFYVPPHSRIMFGRERVFANQGDTLAHAGVSVWHIVPRKSGRTGSHVLDGDSVVEFETAPMATLPIELDFSHIDRQSIVLMGIDGPEQDFAWSDGPVALLWVNTPPVPKDIELLIDASGAITSDHPQGQRVSVEVNGKIIGTPLIPGNRTTRRLLVPKDLWNTRSPKLIVFGFDDAQSPAERGISGDRRLLALRMFHLTIDAADN